MCKPTFATVCVGHTKEGHRYSLLSRHSGIVLVEAEIGIVFVPVWFVIPADSGPAEVAGKEVGIIEVVERRATGTAWMRAVVR